MFGSRGPKRRGPKPRATKSQFEAERSTPGVLETIIGLAPARRPPSAGVAGKLDRRPRLVDLAVDLLALLHATFAPGAQVDVPKLREQWVSRRKAFEALAQHHGHRESDVQAAVYAIAVALDEAVMSHPDRIGLWLSPPGALQLEFHENRDLVGGQRFFSRLEELRRQRETAIEAIEVYDACLALGYRGRFVADPAGRDALVSALFTDITAVRGEPASAVAPNAKRIEEATGETLKELPRWVPAAVLAGAVLLSWLTVVLITFLHARGVASALSRM